MKMCYVEILSGSFNKKHGFFVRFFKYMHCSYKSLRQAQTDNGVKFPQTQFLKHQNRQHF